MNRLFIITTCFVIMASSSHCQKVLPAKWLPGTILTFYTGPGMRPDSHTTIIKEGKCVYINNDGWKSDTSYFKLTTAQLGNIAQILRDYHFEKMQQDDRPVIIYDKRTSTVTLKTGTEVYSLTDSASMLISGKDIEAFRKMKDAISEIVNKMKKDAI